MPSSARSLARNRMGLSREAGSGAKIVMSFRSSGAKGSAPPSAPAVPPPDRAPPAVSAPASAAGWAAPDAPPEGGAPLPAPLDPELSVAPPFIPLLFPAPPTAPSEAWPPRGLPQPNAALAKPKATHRRQSFKHSLLGDAASLPRFSRSQPTRRGGRLVGGEPSVTRAHARACGNPWQKIPRPLARAPSPSKIFTRPTRALETAHP